MASLSVVVHFEALSLLNRLVTKLRSPRGSLVIVMCGLLLAHVVEIWLYGAAYGVLVYTGSMGTLLQANGANDILEPVYFSAMVYTTVGFGDIVPTGPLRLLVGTEALVGLSLITWSASFTFIHMQRLWR